MSSGVQINVDHNGIGKVLEGFSDRSLSVPHFQRSYAWKDENVKNLFQDIGGALAYNETEYFLGSIVVVFNNNNLQIIDGQQRLATITMLLAAIRDYFYSKNDLDSATEIEQRYLLSRRRGEENPRLHLNNDDRHFFENWVLLRPDNQDRRTAKPTTQSHYRIAESVQLAEERVRQIANETSDPSARLWDWEGYIRERVIVIWLTVPDESNAFQIFETLNDRGLRLAISDLLKNYLFSKSSDRITEVQSRWTKMVGYLESVSYDDTDEAIITYIRHLWSSLNGLTREKELYKKIKDQLANKQSVVSFADKLSESAYLYAAMRDSGHDYWTAFGPSVRESISTLIYLRVTQYRPLLLAILNNFDQDEITKSLRLLVSWAVRFLITGGGGGSLEDEYSSKAADISGKRITIARQLQDAMEIIVPNDTEFMTAFKVAKVSKNYLARYYLRVLERQEAGDNQPETIVNPNADEINLEHVLPENLSNEWKIEKEIHEAYWQRIGNMALLKEKWNKNLKNSGFSKKKSSLAQSQLILTNQIAHYDNWGRQEIDQRQEKLAKLAVKAWPAKL